jgi:MFS transporter, DHA1 family, inner membrane transport protein
MSQISTADHTTSDNSIALWAMMFGNFLIGTGVLLPAGLLNDISADFAITPARAGLLSLVGGLVVGVGAPLFATFTSRFDRRLLLTLSLLLYAAGHLASALAPSFDLQLWLRAITIIGAAVFTPQAAATAGLLVPADKRAAAIAFIFIGWSAASVAGIPLGGLISSQFGWRTAYYVMAALSLFGAIGIWFSIKPKLFVQPIGLATWIKAFTSPVILLVFLVTLLSMSGQFTMFAYIARILKDGFGATPIMISIAFLIVGIAGVTGNSLASRVVGKFGVDHIIAAGLASLCIGFIGFALAYGNYALAMIASAFWGLGSFSSNSLQQSRLAGLAPQIASATIALNTSFVYLGQATGAKAGGYLMDLDKMTSLPWMAFAFMSAAIVISLVASRVSQKT